MINESLLLKGASDRAGGPHELRLQFLMLGLELGTFFLIRLNAVERIVPPASAEGTGSGEASVVVTTSMSPVPAVAAQWRSGSSMKLC